jgi:hypothetical protein
LVVFLLRENPTQTVAAGIFGVSQSTVSRRWDALREPIATVLADLRPDPGRGGAGLHRAGGRHAGPHLGLDLPHRPVLRQAP